MPSVIPNQKTNSNAVFGLLYAATIWGVIWYPYRLLAELGVDGLLGGLATYSTALCFGLAVMSLRNGMKALKVPLNVFPLAIAAGWTNIAYIMAVLDGEVVRVMLLFYLSPIWTLIMAHIWLKEHANLKTVFVIVIALIGAFIMLYTPGDNRSWWQQLPLPQNKAEWWGLSAGIGFAVSNIMTRHSVHLNLWQKSFAVWAGVVLMAIVMLLIIPGQPVKFPSISPSHMLLILLIALMLMTATFLVQYGVTHVPAARAAVIFLFELVVAAIAAYFLANEVLHWNEWIGGVLIMLASLLSVKNEQQS